MSKKQNPHIAIVGAGAVGSLFGGMLAKNGENVALIGKNELWLEEIQALLRHVAKTEISENIRGVQWSKLFINAMGNVLDGMTGLTMGEYIQSGDLRRMAVLLLN